MNSKLTTNQQEEICSQLRNFKLKLIYKASIHGFTGAAFHQHCDNKSPTVSVGYNNSGYVFGGYTRQPFSQSGQFVYDCEAFLFSFRGRMLNKYPCINAPYAVRMINNCGPYFGEDLILLNGSQPVVHSSPGKYYNFNARQMHSNDLNLTECEVYQVEGKYDFDERLNKTELMESIQFYKPLNNSVTQARVLLVGPVGVGKSSFFNSINSVFRGHVTSQAISGSSSTSLTTQFRTFSVKAGREGKPLPLVLCDTMGLEENVGAGPVIDDISNILKGHLPDRYQFNPSGPLQSEAHGFCKSPDLKDKIHCVTYVLDASKISIMSTKIEEKLKAIRRTVNLMGIPQLLLLTKIDEACALVREDIRNVYRSSYIKELAAARVGVPLSCIIPVKNYSEELELDTNTDILLLSAVVQMIRFVDNFFDDISGQLSSLTTGK
uniref:TLDc domain-containing protein n=1 Tax=Oryzias melastigma TaxID=30732 RepID=A0A3B3BCP1_ORYME